MLYRLDRMIMRVRVRFHIARLLHGYPKLYAVLYAIGL